MKFNEIQDLLVEINSINTVADSHGIACGMLIVNSIADNRVWIKHIIESVEATDTLSAASIKMMAVWFDEIKNQLQDSNLRFELCLPDDEEQLEDRIYALQEWCRGFLLGIAMSGINDFSELAQDTQELMNDFARIGAEEEFDLDNKDEAEIAYSDISQYVRIGVLLINEEMQSRLSN
jgi:uncharacterized protein YgfB (UPF0149 family)